MPSQTEIPSITPAQYAALLEAGEQFLLVDVREGFERKISVLPNDIHIPMDDFAERMSELSRESLIILYCRTGGRSGIATQLMRQRGYLHVFNLASGINGYARQFDPSMTIY